MKEFALEQLPPDVGALFDAAQSDRVLVTRNGVPIAIVRGIEFKDEEDFQLEASPEFWKMIAERRRETESVSLEEVMGELEKEEQRCQNGVPGAPGTPHGVVPA